MAATSFSTKLARFIRDMQTHPTRALYLAVLVVGGIGVIFLAGVILNATGISIGRDTYEMLDNPHLHQIPLDEARRGDLLFYGTGHVEFDTEWYHVSFGAHDWGTRVGWARWNGWWSPTMAFEVW